MDHTKKGQREMKDVARALREGGMTQRLHTIPTHRHYDVAQHSWTMAALLFALHPDPSRELIYSCLFHDVAERWVGDTPAPAKWWIAPDLGTALKKAEEKIGDILGINFALDDRDRAWLRGLDILELYLYCMDEVALGNRHIEECMVVCAKLLHEDRVPAEIKGWLKGKTWGRTTDALGAPPEVEGTHVDNGE